jgi:multidrug resistance efflux pump
MLLDRTEAEVKGKKIELKLTEKAAAEEQVKLAQAGVTAAGEELKGARLIADECVVRAKADGVVERVEAAPGLVVGPGTRTPLLWLVPNGPRVVRAEVVPEYAYKIHNKVGQRVTILDDNNPTLTYEGEVQRVSGSFLPKRGLGVDFTTGKPMNVLEVIIAVKDPAPAGKPPLRVGQPVRVSIGQ